MEIISLQNYENIFIGIVDILGYGEVERRLDSYGSNTSVHFLKQIFHFPDERIIVYNKAHKGIPLIHYGDGLLENCN